ncbi:hypothetical protein ACRALDRAFT_1061302 [Sodiomyces alcalophilus JCM 7366]|uniref:uncharacterized protein n=1 Tax=Sodiomyces alcalophilus JCM 7366 TaxID=591952 RepID=UPI0039B65CCB
MLLGRDPILSGRLRGQRTFPRAQPPDDVDYIKNKQLTKVTRSYRSLLLPIGRSADCGLRASTSLL